MLERVESFLRAGWAKGCGSAQEYDGHRVWANRRSRETPIAVWRTREAETIFCNGCRLFIIVWLGKNFNEKFCLLRKTSLMRWNDDDRVSTKAISQSWKTTIYRQKSLQLNGRHETLSTVSVTRWVDYFFNVWPSKCSKFCQILKRLFKTCQSLLEFCPRGEISPNLVTLSTVLLRLNRNGLISVHCEHRSWRDLSEIKLSPSTDHLWAQNILMRHLVNTKPNPFSNAKSLPDTFRAFFQLKYFLSTWNCEFPCLSYQQMYAWVVWAPGKQILTFINRANFVKKFN